MWLCLQWSQHVNFLKKNYTRVFIKEREIPSFLLPFFPSLCSHFSWHIRIWPCATPHSCLLQRKVVWSNKKFVLLSEGNPEEKGIRLTSARHPNSMSPITAVGTASSYWLTDWLIFTGRQRIPRPAWTTRIPWSTRYRNWRHSGKKLFQSDFHPNLISCFSRDFIYQKSI